LAAQYGTGWERSLDEKRIQQVLEIEKQAQAIHDDAVSEAAQLPLQADKEAQALIEKARADAQEEARQLVAKAQAAQDSEDVLTEAEERVKRIETLASGNFNRAVSYVLARVVGREQK
jgi:V/A-type H+/Na+-transporting ATPase subunit G/H